MAIETGAYSYLFDPIFQVEGIAGKPCVGGHIEVYKSGTDEKVITLSDWDGTVNPFKIPLGSDGRAVILVDIGYTYDAYIYDSFNNLICSRLNIIPLSNGDVTVQGLSQVYHDSTTLSGKGTPDSPLTVINGGSGLSTIITQWPVEGNGSEGDPVTINDLTLLATDGTMTAYNAEVEGSNAIVLGVNGEWFNQATTGFQTKSDMNNYVTNNTLITQVNTLNNKITNNSNAITATNAEVDKKLYTSAFNNEITAYAKITDIESQLATKQDKLTDYDPNTWNTVTAKLNTSDFESVSGDFALKSEIPSLDGYATENFVTNITDNKLDTSAFNNSITAYALKSDIPVVPTNVGAFTNDVGYLTEHQSLDGLMAEDKLTIEDGKITEYDGTPFAGGEDNNTFVAVYGQTSYEDILAAYNSGKAIMAVREDSQKKQGLYTLTYFTSDTFYFTSLMSYYASNDVRYDTIYRSQSTWNTEGQKYSVVANHATNISAYYDKIEIDNTLTAYAKTEDIPVVPTNVGAFTNDVGYLTEHQSLTAYALKSELPVIGTIEV